MARKKATARRRATQDAPQLEDPLPDEPPQPELAATTGEILRPSQLREIMAKDGRLTNKPLDKPARYIREKGLPNPVRLIRVTLRKHSRGGPLEKKPLEINAVDESEALRMAMDAHRIPYRERHNWRGVAVILEE